MYKPHGSYDLSYIFNGVVFSFQMLFLCCFMLTLSVGAIAMTRNSGSGSISDSATTVVEQPAIVITHHNRGLKEMDVKEYGEEMHNLGMLLSACRIWEMGVDFFAKAFKCTLLVDDKIKEQYGFDQLKKIIEDKPRVESLLNKEYEKKGSLCELFKIYNVNATKMSVSGFRLADTVDEYINWRKEQGVNNINFDEKIGELNGRFFEEDSWLKRSLLVDMPMHCKESESMTFEDAEKNLDIEPKDNDLCWLEGIPFGVTPGLNVKGFITVDRFGGKEVKSKCSESCPAVRQMEKLSPSIYTVCPKSSGFFSNDFNVTNTMIQHPFTSGENFLSESYSIVALAQCHGLTPWALNIDHGGSCRMSFASCGLPALKVTTGKILLGNHCDNSSELSSVGLSANCTKDIMRLYGILTNTVPSDYIIELRKQLLSADTSSINSAEQKEQPLDVAKVKVLVLDSWISSAEESIKILCNKAVEDLRKKSLMEVKTLREISENHGIINEWFNDFSSQYLVYSVLFEREEVHASLHNDNARELLSEFGVRFESHVSLHLSQMVSNDNKANCIADSYRRQLKNIMKNVFSNVDVIVCPSMSATSMVLPSEYWISFQEARLSERMMRYMLLSTLTGIPAITVPIGMSDDGMPVGLQIMGKEGADYLVTTIAEAVEKKCGRISIPKKKPMRASIAETH